MARKRPATPLDPVTSYAQGVIAGTYPAGPHVRGACKRHMADLKAGVWTWDAAAVDRVLGFFRDVLVVDNTQRAAPGDPDTVPFVLLPWQAFVVGSLFGWKGPDGFRRFRTCYVESGKGSGKSPLAAGIGLYGLLADGEPRAEVYAAASTKDQARVLFRDAVAMARGSGPVSARVDFSGGQGQEWNIAALSTGSFFRIVAADTAQSGPRPHIALLDEIHEHHDDSIVKMMRAGTKGRRQAIILMITNSGSDRTGVCWNYHEYARKVCAGDIQDGAFFAYVCALDDGDQPMTDESCWAKANPSLGVTFHPKYLRELVTQARGMPSSEAGVMRLNFCTWTDAENPWIDRDRWDAAEQDVDLDELRGLQCFAGLDLSAKKDLTSLGVVWVHPDGRLTLASWFWTPGDTLDGRARVDNVPYAQWRDEGHLFAPPGRLIDKGHVAVFVQALMRDHDLKALAFDQAQIEDFEAACDTIGFEVWIDERKPGAPPEPDGAGLRMVRHGQGFAGYAHPTTLWMPRSIDATEAAIIGGQLAIKRNPVLRWNSASAVLLSDPQNNRKWDKRKSNGRIDGMVAGSMAVGMARAGAVAPVRSMWDDDAWDAPVAG